MTTTMAPNDLSTDYALTQEQIAGFRRDGHVLLRAVATPQEIAEYQPVITAAADKYNSETRPMEERDTYGKAFLQIMNLWVKDEAVRRFTLARRFAKIAADLMGVDGVRLYHDQALYKEPGGGPTPWHQDQFYWPLDTDKTITLWMPLVDIRPEVGSMTFASGSDKLGSLGELEISDESEAVFNQFVHDKGLNLTTYGAMAAGDATYHAGWTLHSAPGNPTDKTREIMTIIYFADGARALSPDNPFRENDLRGWLPGIQPGEFAASENNPVVFTKS